MKKYALIGRGIDHSFSKDYFNRKFIINKISASYSNIDVEDKSELNNIPFHEYEGLNVTMPYKESVIPLLDTLSPVVKDIMAVNTIVKRNDELIGYNTDIYGFDMSLKLMGIKKGFSRKFSQCENYYSA